MPAPPPATLVPVAPLFAVAVAGAAFATVVVDPPVVVLVAPVVVPAAADVAVVSAVVDLLFLSLPHAAAISARPAASATTEALRFLVFT